MFKVIDLCQNIYDAFGVFLDEDGDIQFILCDCYGEFYKTNETAGFYTLYRDDK